jgi:hypothetical protein
MDLGWLVHLGVLEPEQFKTDVVVPPKVDRRTKKGKSAWAKFEAANPDKLFFDASTHEKAAGMSKSMLEHETASVFFSGPGQNEISIVWVDAETELLCKARIDRVSMINEWPFVGDLKTARDASRSEFERAIHRYQYHVQAAHYLAGLETLYPIEAGAPYRRFGFFVVESSAPYCCACYELDDIAREEGERLRRKYLHKWKECTESGNWPGYAPGMDYASIPPWALKNYQTD